MKGTWHTGSIVLRPGYQVGPGRTLENAAFRIEGGFLHIRPEYEPDTVYVVSAPAVDHLTYHDETFPTREVAELDAGPEPVVSRTRP